MTPPPWPILSIKAFDDFVTSITDPTATGWNDSCGTRFTPAEDARLCTAHINLTTRDGGEKEVVPPQ
jgi:hypothetical protein